jgi:hypothetical protein
MDRIIEFAFSRHDLLVLRLRVAAAEVVGVGPMLAHLLFWASTRMETGVLVLEVYDRCCDTLIPSFRELKISVENIRRSLLHLV